MKAGIARALLEDAYHQVMDNWVFRLLVILVIVLVAPTFLISMREDEMVVFFGLFDWGRIRYDDFLGAFNQSTQGIEDLHVAAIQTIQSLLVEGLAGTIGILLTIAATAFFVPRMLEKGAADTLFSKPLSRLTLLVSRYLTGVLFVAILAGILIGGMHLGFLLCSGYSDPGFLWGALTLVYVFAVVHAFSVCVATLTRSSVAAILLSGFFFMGTGCVHGIWIQKEYAQESEQLQLLRQQAAAPDAPDASSERPRNRMVTILLRTLDTLHYTLPKTTDAGYLTRMLRRTVTGTTQELRDEEADLTVEAVAEGLERDGPTAVDLAETPAVWVRRAESGAEEVRLELSREYRGGARRGDSERSTNPLSAAKALEAELAERADVVGVPDRNRDTAQFVDELYAHGVDWTEERDGATVHRHATFFMLGDWLFRVDATFSDACGPDERQEILREHLAEYDVGAHAAGAVTPDRWYERQLGLAAPLRFNVLFSLGSTLAFCVLALGVSWLRLQRIDF